MIKKGFRQIFIQFRNARIDLRLLVLFSAVMLVFMVVFVNAITISQSLPGNQTSNGSRSVNFTFTPIWDNAGDEGATSATSANCSIWTNITGTWAETQTNGTKGNGTSWLILNNTLS